MPIDLEKFKLLQERRRVFPTAFECECGRRLVAGSVGQDVRCICGLVWHVRETFAFCRTKGGTYVRYWCQK
jgi:hypothetical protein